LVESELSHNNCGATSSHWVQARVNVESNEMLHFPMCLFCFKMAPNEIKNGAQCFFGYFDSRLFRSKFFVKAVSVLLFSFALSHFHKSNSNLLQENQAYFLVFHMPKK